MQAVITPLHKVPCRPHRRNQQHCQHTYQGAFPTMQARARTICCKAGTLLLCLAGGLLRKVSRAGSTLTAAHTAHQQLQIQRNQRPYSPPATAAHRAALRCQGHRAMYCTVLAVLFSTVQCCSTVGSRQPGLTSCFKGCCCYPLLGPSPHSF